MSQSLKELAANLVRLKDKKRDLEKEIEDVKSELDQLSQEMVPILEEMEAQNVKLDGIGTIFLQTKCYVTAVKEVKEQLIAWLDNNGQGHLAKRDIHPQTLQAEYQSWMAEDKPVPPAELVKVFPKTEVRLRRAK